MSSKSRIEWTDATWNPVTGCTKISTGCKNCYAERIAKRFWDRPFAEVRCHPDKLFEPKKWRKPRKVFVCSMSDLFHKDVPDSFISDVFMAMALDARQHTYMILTKRPARMMEFMNGSHECVQHHIWLGVSVENQEMADERIPILLDTSAVIRFVSVEPMLGEVNLEKYFHGRLRKLDWVICGCESGRGARPTNVFWADLLRAQCQLYKIPFFLKQLRGDGRLIKMPELNGRVWDQYPEDLKRYGR